MIVIPLRQWRESEQKFPKKFSCVDETSLKPCENKIGNPKKKNFSQQQQTLSWNVSAILRAHVGRSGFSCKKNVGLRLAHPLLAVPTHSRPTVHRACLCCIQSTSDRCQQLADKPQRDAGQNSSRLIKPRNEYTLLHIYLTSLL